MEKVYLISGLGADRRLFNYLNLPGYELIPVDWLQPDSADSLGVYAQNLIDEYQIAEGAIVAGVSLGGMLTVEISSRVNLKCAILISSIQSVREFPWYYKIFRCVPVYRIIPVQLLPALRTVVNPVFGLRSKAETNLFVEMIRDISPAFFKWAVHAVLHWQPPVPLKPVYQIHGNKDVVFSSRRAAKSTIIVDKGGHNMVFNRVDEVSAAIINILKNEVT
ncbi:alpha/beta hydrolase [Mucilaginibacter sp.]